jgi:hypothetical protein
MYFGIFLFYGISEPKNKTNKINNSWNNQNHNLLKIRKYDMANLFFQKQQGLNLN